MRCASLIVERETTDGRKVLRVQVAGKEYTPEELSAMILKEVRARAGNPTKAVITVPAYFDDTRRKATQDAGRIAGLETVDIFDEPCAAALSYAFADREDAGTEQTVLVYDLGGGTFDVSVLKITPENMPEAQLAKLGLSKPDVTLMIQSHTHIDHVGHLDGFPGVPILIAKTLSASDNTSGSSANWTCAGLTLTRKRGLVRLSHSSCSILKPLLSATNSQPASVRRTVMSPPRGMAVSKHCNSKNPIRTSRRR